MDRAFKISLIFVILIVLFTQILSAEMQGDMLLPESFSKAESNVTANIVIHANVYDAQIYLNGEYQGLTPIKIKNLTPGQYFLTVKKQGYKEKTYAVSLPAGRTNIYYIKTEKSTGRLLLQNLQPGSSIYIDGIFHSDNPIDLTEDFHTVKVRCFGYDDFSVKIRIERLLTQTVVVNMPKAIFKLSGPTVSQKQFNPKNRGSLGRTSISFNVTAPGTGILRLENSSGTEIRSWKFDRFSTWKQTVLWDGTDDNGIYVPDGSYTAIVLAENFKGSIAIKIDRTISYPLSSMTADGTGIGELPSPLVYPVGTYFTALNISPIFTPNMSNRILFDIAAFLGGTPVKQCEWSIRAALHAGADNTPVTIGGALKVVSRSTGAKAGFAYGGVFRYGYSTETSDIPEDNGNGLGIGLMGGVKSDVFYTGILCEYIFGYETGIISGTDDCWKNGITAYLTPVPYISVKTWIASNSIFKKNESSNWFDTTKAGIAVSILIPDSAVTLDASASVVAQQTEIVYFSTKAGLIFVF